MKNVLTPVETVVDINRQDILWYEIPGYRGYELSNTGLVRSMKHYKRYPYGIILEKQDKDIYVLSNADNQRVRVSMAEIVNLVKNDPHRYAKYTFQVNRASRNPREFVHREVKKLDQTPRPFQFKVIDK